ncbi:uncharacterized protein [Littorina saxatilis]|uniref:uncharacterized protein n=1 Tax=Littorina saxatilis TaxID=31220 RepID=UPI0038B55BC0
MPFTGSNYEPLSVKSVFFFTISLLFWQLNTSVKAVRMYPCDTSGYYGVVENSTITFHCDQYAGSVEWRYRGPSSPSAVLFSTCNATWCTPSFFHAFTSTYISASNNSFSSNLTIRDVRVAGGEYICSVNSCKLHIIVPAVLSKPTSAFTRTDQGYTIPCHAGITQVYSSRGLYSCVWQVGINTQSVTPNLLPSPIDTNNTSDRAGSCDVILPFLIDTGAYDCSVAVSPGNTQVSSDTFQIVRPSQPVLSCPSDPVPENSTVTCTCSTDNIGQPGGRLRLYTGTNNNFDTEVISGAYDVSSLTMTWQVTRSDHDVRQFRCVNNWSVNVTAQDGFTVTVATSPSMVNLTLNSQSGLLQVKENQSLTVGFICTASGAPPPNLLLTTEDGKEVARLRGIGLVRQSRLLHTLSLSGARCEDSAVYTCTADNGVGQPVSSSAALRVLCTMRVITSSFTSVGDDVPLLTFEGHQGQLGFQVITMETPNAASFLFLGPSLNTSAQPPRLGLLSAECTMTSVAYKSNCVITASNVTEQDTGYYTVSLATHNETVTVTFSLKQSENMSPESSDSDTLGFAAGVGVGISVMVFFDVVAAAIWFGRHRGKLQCAGKTAAAETETVQRGHSTNSGIGLSTDVSDAQAGNDPYDQLKQDEIGLRSIYEVVGQGSRMSGAAPISDADGYEIPVHMSESNAPARQRVYNT